MGAQKLTSVLENLYTYINMSTPPKLKNMLVKDQNKDNSCVNSFKYLGLKVPSNHRWNEWVTCYLGAGKRVYYAFENTYNNGEIKC